MVLGARLLVRGIPPWGPWDRGRLDYRVRSDISPWLNTRAGDRMVCTMLHLEGTLTTPAPVRIVWISENLEMEARKVWEMRTKS
jgi:hypothetical protein